MKPLNIQNGSLSIFRTLHISGRCITNDYSYFFFMLDFIVFTIKYNGFAFMNTTINSSYYLVREFVIANQMARPMKF